MDEDRRTQWQNGWRVVKQERQRLTSGLPVCPEVVGKDSVTFRPQPKRGIKHRRLGGQDLTMRRVEHLLVLRGEEADCLQRLANVCPDPDWFACLELQSAENAVARKPLRQIMACAPVCLDCELPKLFSNFGVGPVVSLVGNLEHTNKVVLAIRSEE